ncbi:MAG: hypothetical protein AAGC54_11730, partial [Cyanobacteria bacterium P01_F01_bin.4]
PVPLCLLSEIRETVMNLHLLSTQNNAIARLKADTVQVPEGNEITGFARLKASLKSDDFKLVAKLMNFSDP